MKKTGLQLIQQERDEQIHKHGYSKEFHTANMQYYGKQQLLQAGNYCVFPVPEDWPEDWLTAARDKIANKDRIGQLACGGAFYMAHAELFGMNDYIQGRIDYCANTIDKLLSQEP